jgi:hypothetical protein
MSRVVGILAIFAVASGCAQLPLPITSGVPATGASAPCADRLSEPSCKEVERCRWIGDYRRADGTYATAHCTEGNGE